MMGKRRGPVRRPLGSSLVLALVGLAGLAMGGELPAATEVRAELPASARAPARARGIHDADALPGRVFLPLLGGPIYLDLKHLWRVPGDFPTLAAALDAAGPGDTILLAPGRYPASGLVLPERLRLLGAGRGETWIDGSGAGEGGLSAVLSLGAGAELAELSILGPAAVGAKAGLRVLGGGATLRDLGVFGAAEGIRLACARPAACGGTVQILRAVVAGHAGDGVVGGGGLSLALRDSTLVDNGGRALVLGTPLDRAERNILVGGRVGLANPAAAPTGPNAFWDQAESHPGSRPGAGDIVADPLFENRAGGDYRLSAGSPLLREGRAAFGALDFGAVGEPPAWLRGRPEAGPGDATAAWRLAWQDNGAAGFRLYLGATPERFERRIDVGSNSVEHVIEDLPSGAALWAAVSTLGAGGESLPSPVLPLSPPEAPDPPAAVLRVPEDYPTLREGLAAAQPGDALRVAPGVYAESGLTVGPGVRLIGAGWRETVIDGGGAAAEAAWVLAPEPDSLIAGFTIRGGRQSDHFDSGIWVTRGPVTIRDNRITGNGTGVYSWCFDPATCDLRLTIEGNLIDHNAGAGVNSNDLSVILARRNTIADNGAADDRRNNGASGIVVAHPASELEENIVARNRHFGLANLGAGRARHNLVWRNGQDYAGMPGPAEGDLAQDPLWRDAEVGDYRLLAGSPAIEAGLEQGRDLGALPFVPAGRAPQDLRAEPLPEAATWLLRWAERPGAQAYRLYLGPAEGPYEQVLAPLAAAEYPLEGLSPGRAYRAAVSSLSLDGEESRLSEPIRFSMPVLANGHLEEDSPALMRQGAWQVLRDPDASGGALLQSDTPGASVALAFGGDRLVLGRRVGPDGGRARLRIDGQAWGDLDFHLPEPRSAVPAVFDGLGPGPHTLQLVVAEEASPGAQGRAVALDFFAIPGELALSAAQRAGVERVNHYRGLVGVPPAREAMAIHLAAQAHADYAVRVPGGAHLQAPGQPGFVGATPSDRARFFGFPEAVWEDIHFTGDPAAAVDGWMATVYHRLPIIRYELVQAGFGLAREGDWKVEVLDMSRGLAPPAPAERRIVTFPVDGQTEVPPAWIGAEAPDPLPGLPKPVGYPVSLSLEQAVPLDPPAPIGSPSPWRVDIAEIVEYGGDPVPVHVLAKGTDAPQVLGEDIVFVIARAPLEPHKRYAARVSGIDSRGAYFDRRWWFTTGARAADLASGEAIVPRSIAPR